MTTIGYARTSTVDQVAGLADQISTLEAAGCERIYREHISGSTVDRPELAACLDYVREGDVLIVTKPDRLARSVTDLLGIVAQLQRKGVALRILSMGVDTSNPTGALILTILGGVAQWEREIMLERQRAGIAKAQAEGKYKGRKPTIDHAKAAQWKEDGVPVAEIARRFKVNPSTIWRALAAAE